MTNKRTAKPATRPVQSSMSQKEILVTLVFVDGRTTHEAAQIADVSENTARSIINSYKREGETVEKAK
ncbi:unnamed protein product [Heligmosomoides polygyrus]|uniref:Helix-turn-helix domain-containing protein n=1 Tax=Heligmosomoides polygyrus TaxID=6339 RepID=A0A183GV82_HELPZ|nr:unnamed protein product [Heligmosomoides polygyrus]